MLAKEPVPGRVKTRLSPPCDPVDAAALAAAALADTLDAAMVSGADRVIVALDGAPGPWCPPGAVIVAQGDGCLADRLAAAWSATAGPALQIGMDTPQVSAAELDRAMTRLNDGTCDSVLGLAQDGGWWAIGFQCCPNGVFDGIATSRPDTGARQLERLEALGLRTALLQVQRDVDSWDDALAVAELVPDSAFGRAVRAVAGVPA